MWLDRRTPSRKSRSLERILELTSRISSAEISKSLEQLAIKNSSKGSVHTCLASSIMEVGVDVQRLGLLTIMSQPKLTAQYIQVSGRVGRARAEGPGLVVMLYNTNRTRDRSVYERFPTFHKRLYANVEPLSVTSFAVQTLQKGLAGSIIALYRMWSPSNQSATDLDVALFDKVVKVLKVRLLDLPKGINNLKDFEDKVQDLKSRWLRYQPTNWEYTYQQKNGQSTDASTALMRGERDKLYSIPNDDSIYVPNSMRNVDGQTGLRVVANPYGFVGVEGKNDGD
jgi:superfamily II DNA/RNA helicase